MPRRLALLTICLAIAAVLALPGRASADAADHTVHWSSQGDALTFDPHGQDETPTIAALLQVYETLIRRAPDMSIEPSLATSWRRLDPVTWEFKIRQGVRFHDGTPLTAEDIKFSIERAQTPPSDYTTYVRDIKRVEIVDRQTIRFITDGPDPLLLENIINVYVMSKAWSAKHGVLVAQNRKAGEENYAVRHANGTGPFKLELREPDVRTIMVRSDDWWGLKKYPHNVDRIVFTPIANAATRVAALLSGELDFLLDPPLQDLERIRRTGGLDLKSTPQQRTIFLGMDQGKGELESSDVKGRNPFKDHRVREAMYRAINAVAIQRAIMRGQSAPAGMLAAPGVAGHTGAYDKRLPYDPKKAKALLAEAGYPNGFRVRLDCPNDRYVNDEAICQAVVGMLAKVGIRVDLDLLPKSLHFPKIENRTTEFYMLGWGVTTLDSENVFNFLYRTGATWNATGYSNPRVDALIGKIRAELDPAKRTALINEAWGIVVKDIVYLPLHHQMVTWAMKQNFDIPIEIDNMPRFFWGRFK